MVYKVNAKVVQTPDYAPEKVYLMSSMRQVGALKNGGSMGFSEKPYNSMITKHKNFLVVPWKNCVKLFIQW